MDQTVGALDRIIITSVREQWPAVTLAEATFVAQFSVLIGVVALFNLLGVLARYAYHWIARYEDAHTIDEADLANTEEVMQVRGRDTFATLLRPLGTLLPLFGYLVAAQRACAGVDVLTHACHKSGTVPAVLDQALHNIVKVADPLQTYVANAIGVLVIVSFTWTVLLLKKRYFLKLLAQRARNMEAEDAVQDLQRLLLPANQLLTWLIIAISAVSCFRCIGLDPSPILALGSVSGVAVGFASQQLLLNLIAGINIFVSRPFVVGDYIEARTGTMLHAKGTIVSITPLRTQFIDDASNSLTIPNKALLDMNLTNFRFPPSVGKKGSTKGASIRRKLSHEVTLAPPPGNEGPYDDYAKEVVKAVLVRLSIVKNIVRGSTRAAVTSLSSKGDIVISVSAETNVVSARSMEAVRQSFMLSIHRALAMSHMKAGVANEC